MCCYDTESYHDTHLLHMGITKDTGVPCALSPKSFVIRAATYATISALYCLELVLSEISCNSTFTKVCDDTNPLPFEMIWRRNCSDPTFQ
ncbi:hypothetical protein Tco_0230498 [Tanacetum coccineum]